MQVKSNFKLHINTKYKIIYILRAPDVWWKEKEKMGVKYIKEREWAIKNKSFTILPSIFHPLYLHNKHIISGKNLTIN